MDRQFKTAISNSRDSQYTEFMNLVSEDGEGGVGVEYEIVQRPGVGGVADNRAATDGSGSSNGSYAGIFHSGHCFHVHRYGGTLWVSAGGAGLAV